MLSCAVHWRDGHNSRCVVTRYLQARPIISVGILCWDVCVLRFVMPNKDASRRVTLARLGKFVNKCVSPLSRPPGRRDWLAWWNYGVPSEARSSMSR